MSTSCMSKMFSRRDQQSSESHDYPDEPRQREQLERDFFRVQELEGEPHQLVDFSFWKVSFEPMIGQHPSAVRREEGRRRWRRCCSFWTLETLGQCQS